MSGASEKWRDRQGPECRASGRQQSVRRDHFPFKVREVERVCGRLRRPQSRQCVAVRAKVPWAAKVPRDWSQAGVTNRERELVRFHLDGKGATATGWG